MRAVRFFGPGRAGNATVWSGCGRPSRQETSWPVSSQRQRSWDARIRTSMTKLLGRIQTTITTMRTRVVHLYSPLVNTRPKIESIGPTANFRHQLRKREKMCAYSSGRTRLVSDQTTRTTRRRARSMQKSSIVPNPATLKFLNQKRMFSATPPPKSVLSFPAVA